MTNLLLDRQRSLLDYLSGRAAIFGDRNELRIAPPLNGIDLRLLRLEARFSHEKRMEKIVAVLPKTFEVGGRNLAETVRAFAEACPPFDITRMANARQFYEFHCTQQERATLVPPYLCDVAACELARAEVMALGDDGTRKAECGNELPPGAFRRHPNAVLLRSAYDVRAIFEETGANVVPPKRETPLAVAVPPGTKHPRICEVSPAIYDLLTALDGVWADPEALPVTMGAKDLINRLAQQGLLEVRA